MTRQEAIEWFSRKDADGKFVVQFIDRLEPGVLRDPHIGGRPHHLIVGVFAGETVEESHAAWLATRRGPDNHPLAVPYHALDEKRRWQDASIINACKAIAIAYGVHEQQPRIKLTREEILARAPKGTK